MATGANPQPLGLRPYEILVFIIMLVLLGISLIVVPLINPFTDEDRMAAAPESAGDSILEP